VEKMSITAFPNGISSYGVPVLGGGSIPSVTGKVFWVDSGTGSDDNDGKKDTPFKTIDYAIGKCVADNDDLVLLYPGHTDTVSAAGTITSDVAGVHILGLGRGLARPTVTYDTAAAACWNITGANCVIENIILTANFADVAKAFDVDAKDFLLKNCSFLETATDMNFLTCVETDDTANAADGLSVVNCERISVDAEALAFVSILGACDRLRLIGNFDNQASAANVGHFLIMAALVCLGAQIIGNCLNLTGDNNAQTVGVFATGSSTTSTGIMAHNLVGSLDTTTELFDTATLDFQHFENYMTGTIAKSGYVLPAIDS
jgi:hypothetical protein